MAPTLATAQEPDQSHPFLSNRFQLAVGAFARQQDFKIVADGSAPNDIPSGIQRGDVDVSAPMPNIGGWYYYSPSKRWLFEARLDWLDVSVGDYSGGIWNSSVGVHFQAFKHLGVGLNYHYFSLNADVDSEDWRGGAELRYRGPFLALTTNW